FSEARIQTLDSYCSSIIKLASRHYGIRPDFSVDDETCVNYAYKQAIPFLLNHRNNKAIIELINNSSIEDIAENLFAKTITQYSNISNPIDFDKLLEKQTEIAKIEWNKITEVIDLITNTIYELTNSFDGKPQKIISALKEIIENNSLPNCPNFDSLIEFYKSHSEIAPINDELKNYLDSINLFNKVSLQGRTTNEKVQEIKNNIKELKNQFVNLCSIASFIANYKISQIIYPLLDEFQNQINEYKRTSGILTFQDISHLAVDVLINHPEIRNIEKTSFKAIMIDEFQDDNQLQRDLLFLLAEKYERNEKSIPNPEELCPDKLFFVGDEKQSIYKFRGADVSVFRKLKSELANNSNLSLITNYRSHPALIAGFNSLFGGYKYPDKIEELEKPTERYLHKASLFLNDEQITDNKKVPDFEATYDWVKPNLTDKEGNPLEINLEPRIHFSVFNNTKIDSNENEDEKEFFDEENIFEDLKTSEIEAMYVAQKIKSLIDEKKYTSKDFAILFRSTTKQYLYEKHLRKLGIQYTSESVVGFFTESPINNIYYLLRLLVYPTDMVAYENLLFSPFVNLSQTGVNICMIHTSEKIKSQHNKISPEEILFSNEIENLLSEDDLQNYQNGKILFLELSEKIKTLSLTEIICELWYNLGNRYETLWCDSVSVYNEMYDYLFEIANQSDENGLGLSDFVDTLETLKENNERLSDMDIPLEKPDAVRLMTIHKSKGLEFPIVFVCGCSSPGRKETSSDIIYYNEENGISLNTKCPNWFTQATQNFFYIKSKDLNTLKREAELRRVLYVAMTRAEKELYLISNFKINKTVKEKILEQVNNENYNFTKKDFSHEELLEIFSQMAVTKICEKEILSNQLAQSKCITNDTFMGFMLYAISEWNKDGEGKYPNCPFKLESIDFEIQEDENFEKRKSAEQLICEIKP
ncbi:MAG: UvrD-helicase domain-containing protein, partial [Spirochaetaceae bacterium]|nr:UvrD-helicase domain-containing protein [Spirochaetaceae bacterium]